MTLPTRFTFLALLSAVAFLCLGLSTPASASVILAIDDPSTPGMDYLFPDSDSDGVVTSGVISAGGFPFSVTVGIGDTGASRLDLQTVGGSFSESAALDLLLTQTDYSFTGQAVSTIGGSADGNVVYAAYFDPSNNPFGLANLIGDPLLLGPGSFFESTFGSIPGSGPFSLTQAISLRPGAGEPAVSQLTASIQVTPVPEPATMTLFGIGSMAAAFLRRRRS